MELPAQCKKKREKESDKHRTGQLTPRSSACSSCTLLGLAATLTAVLSPAITLLKSHRREVTASQKQVPQTSEDRVAQPGRVAAGSTCSLQGVAVEKRASGPWGSSTESFPITRMVTLKAEAGKASLSNQEKGWGEGRTQWVTKDQKEGF